MAPLEVIAEELTAEMIGGVASDAIVRLISLEKLLSLLDVS